MSWYIKMGIFVIYNGSLQRGFMEDKSVVEALQAKIKELGLDVQYNLHLLQEKEKMCNYLEDRLKDCQQGGDPTGSA